MEHGWDKACLFLASTFSFLRVYVVPVYTIASMFRTVHRHIVTPHLFFRYLTWSKARSSLLCEVIHLIPDQ